MSIIVFRDGIVAADRIVVCGYNRVPLETDKITLMPDGRVAGACGRSGYCEAFLKWARGERAEMPAASTGDKEHGGDMGLIFSAAGSVEIFDEEGSYTVTPEYFASGAGEGIAYGAFFMGATAEQAARAVVRFDVFTGGEPQVIDMRKVAADVR